MLYDKLYSGNLIRILTEEAAEGQRKFKNKKNFDRVSVMVYKHIKGTELPKYNCCYVKSVMAFVMIKYSLMYSQLISFQGCSIPRKVLWKHFASNCPWNEG